MVRRFLLALLSLGLLLGVVSPVAMAVDPPTATRPSAPTQPKNTGLYISPLRSYLTLKAGDDVTRAFTVANLTNDPITVTAHVEQFTVADFSYDYRFDEVDNDWVKLVETAVTLKPGESHQMAYHVSVPRAASPGGHYYTLFASSTINGGATASTIQATTLLYLTVDGALQRTFTITSSLPKIVLSPNISYGLTVRNTGNIHYFGYSESRVDGLFYHNAPSGNSQLFMPGTTRTVKNSIGSPLLPGFYKLSYHFNPDQGTRFEGSQYFLFLPPWSIALLIIVATVTGNLLVRRVRHKK